MEQPPPSMGGIPPAPSAGYPQQRVPASTQYGGPTSGGYPQQQQQQQQQYQQQAPGYGQWGNSVFPLLILCSREIQLSYCLLLYMYVLLRCIPHLSMWLRL